MHGAHTVDRFLEDWSCIFSYSRETPDVGGNLRFSNCFVFALRQWMTALNSADRRWNQALQPWAPPKLLSWQSFSIVLLRVAAFCISETIIVPQAPPRLKLCITKLSVGSVEEKREGVCVRSVFGIKFAVHEQNYSKSVFFFLFPF